MYPQDLEELHQEMYTYFEMDTLNNTEVKQTNFYQHIIYYSSYKNIHTDWHKNRDYEEKNLTTLVDCFEQLSSSLSQETLSLVYSYRDQLLKV